MAKKNTKRKLIGLVSILTGHRIYTTKNTQNNPEPLVKNAYDPIAKKHTQYKETKKNLGRNEVKPRKS
ncbi:MAG TPA: 50S ribosomal protein L33 [Candidatus Saccharimonadales bacterium]